MSKRDPHDRGRSASRPAKIPLKGWKDVLLRVKDEATEDNLTLVAAGVTFYLLLSIFPALAALVSVYGLVTDPADLQGQLAALSGLMPEQALELIQLQLSSLVEQAGGALGFGFLLGVAFAIWSANRGISSIFTALNIVYEERETRGFVKRTLITLAFTVGAILFAALLIFLLGVMPALGLGAVAWLRWPLLVLAVAVAIALIYRYGPSRETARWSWVTWGGGVATVVWVAGSALFSWYVGNFGAYDATYGALGAVVGLMMWLWLSSLILLLGAELNAELERQTARDTTTGEEKPMGHRGAAMADTVAGKDPTR